MPHKHAGKPVTLKATTSGIKIYSDNQQIASHRRCYDKYQSASWRMKIITGFGKTSVGSAIAKALDHQAFHWEYIKNIVLESGSYHHHPVVSTKHSKEIMDLDVEQPDLSRYDEFN